jgi:hypothetical protein
MRLLSEHPAERPARLDRDWPAVLTHTHNWRFREGEKAGSFPPAEEQLVRWCRDLGIRAVGVGSAWNPANEANFQRFEGPDRNLYYSGQFDQKSVMDAAGVNATLTDLNAQSHGSTLFYLDNETPKSRMGHPRQLGYKNVKYINRLTITDNLKQFGKGLGSGELGAEDGYAWYAASDSAVHRKSRQGQINGDINRASTY